MHKHKLNKQKTGREKTVRILKMVAIGALMIGVGAAPSPRAMQRLLKELVLGNTPENRRYAFRKVRNLEKQGYLAKHGVKFAVTDKGARTLSVHQLNNLQITKTPRWNGTWHLVMFDIPLAESSERKILNRILLGLGLVQYQQSVLIYPYPIKGVVLHICRFYKITRYVSFVIADEVDGSGKLKKHFKLG